LSATLRFAERPDRALFSSSSGPTVLTNVPMTNSDFTLTAGTYNFAVTVDGNTVWTHTGFVVADLHVYRIPNIGSRDTGTVAGVTTLVV
jgi:hypothetical protein